MTKRLTTPKTIALGVAATLAIGGGTAAVAGAAGGTPTKTKPTPAQRAEKRKANKAEHQAEFAKALGVSVKDVQQARTLVKAHDAQQRAAAEKARAQKLGLTVEQLRDKRADAVAKRLAKAVTNKRLTQAEVDSIVQAIREGKPVRPAIKKVRAAHRKAQRAAHQAAPAGAQG